MLSLLLLTLSTPLLLQAEDNSQSKSMLERPLMERYILDELKSIRIDNQQTRIDVEERIARSKVEQTDRAARYLTDTIGNIFYIIAAATSILFFGGWNSLRDIRRKTERMIEERVEAITLKYHTELEELQVRLSEQSQKIINNQNMISNTHIAHSLWMRANLESNPQSKIDIYDEILKIHDEDAEVYAYKADAVLDLDECEWALNLSNKAINIDPEYGYAYWQRSCANAILGNSSEAIEDLKIALEKAPNLREEIQKEPSFSKIKNLKDFKEVTI
ncbi:tetratricopeptide repeat protein [Sulfurimonas aquatica]|uniref:Tetratricopeptide repeat protein n=1 Tax=Sulfurimonas aquatica TaxID=2672570 RepID=A0A975GC27_9BACT|nr:tetratricopeptide repeat protein [Sulfurimonas aquatica]QSZ41077.1 tetratricopeptide repeat protein [Sulfurimonas aquatica]